ncbi:hypothetical protein AZA_26524 [Nitrospirillum viridazoti Y2]|nr:hypothetical protein AZA_26524 [Nitrospirillum amazonense Y2]
MGSRKDRQPLLGALLAKPQRYWKNRLPTAHAAASIRPVQLPVRQRLSSDGASLSEITSAEFSRSREIEGLAPGRGDGGRSEEAEGRR